MSSVSPSATVSAASSRAARVSRRSSHSSTSRGSRVRPSRLHSASRMSEARVSRRKWTARSSSGWRVAGVLEGPGRGHVQAVDEDHHRVAGEDRGLGRLGRALLELCSSRTYWLCSLTRPRYMSGPTTTTTHAPSVNLTVAKMSTMTAVRKAEKPFTSTLRRQCVAPGVEVVLDHARPGHGEAGEHPDGVQRHQAGHLGLGGQDQGQGHHGEHDDPVGEGQPVAPAAQLFGQVGVLGHEAGQEGEPVEAGVAPGVEDHHRGELDEVEEHAADGAGARGRSAPPGTPPSACPPRRARRGSSGR